MIYLKVLSLVMPIGTEENIMLIRVVGLWSKNQMEDLVNTK
jgi:hypothetical protein